jgi:hypothetical protein
MEFSRIIGPTVRIIFLGLVLALAAITAASVAIMLFMLAPHSANAIHLAHDKPRALIAIYGLILALGCGGLCVLTFIQGVVRPDEIWQVDEKGVQRLSRFLKYERRKTWPVSRLGRVHFTKKSGMKDNWRGYITLRSGGRINLPIIRDEATVLQLEKILNAELQLGRGV